MLAEAIRRTPLLSYYVSLRQIKTSASVSDAQNSETPKSVVASGSPVPKLTGYYLALKRRA
jgi:hypothetical protein